MNRAIICVLLRMVLEGIAQSPVQLMCDVSTQFHFFLYYLEEQAVSSSFLF